MIASFWPEIDDFCARRVLWVRILLSPPVSLGFSLSGGHFPETSLFRPKKSNNSREFSVSASTASRGARMSEHFSPAKSNEFRFAESNTALPRIGRLLNSTAYR